MKQGKNRAWRGIFYVLIACFLSLSLTPPVRAANLTLAQSADLYYGSIMLRDCVVQSQLYKGGNNDPPAYYVMKADAEDLSKLMSDDYSSYKGTAADVGLYMGYWNGNPYDGRVDCHNSNALQRALTMAGYANVEAFLFDLGFKRNTSGTTVSYDRSSPADLSKLQQKISDAGMNDAKRYYVYEYIMKATCKGTADTNVGGTNVTLKSVVPDPADAKKYIIQDTPFVIPNANQKLEHFDYNGTQTNTTTCGDLVNKLNAFAQDLLDYNNAHQENPYVTGSQSGMAGGEGGNGKGTSATCAIQGIGWIVCPFMNFTATMLDASYAIISGLTAIPPHILGDPAKRAWDVFRDMANIIAVIAFMILIFSQVSSVGISNYGIKKMLPKVIVVVILVNISFFLCQLAVDLSNLIGSSLYALLRNMEVYKQSSDFWEQGNQATNIIGAILASVGGTVAVGGVIAGGIALATMEGALVVILPIAIVAIFAILITLTILVMRPAFIILLTVMAPVAIASVLLPNTGGLYKKWQKFFLAILVLFPSISLLFGGAQLAAAILIQSMGFGKASIADNLGGAISVFATMNLPLLAVLPMIKGSLNAAPLVGSALNKFQAMGGKIAGFSKNKLKENAGLIAATAQRNPGSRRWSMLNKGVNGAGVTFRGKTYGQTRATLRSARAAKEYNDAEIAAAAYQTQDILVKDAVEGARTGSLGGKSFTHTERLALVDKAMTSGGFSDRRKILESLSAGDMSDPQHKELVNRAIRHAYSKGDQAVYGVSFGDAVLGGSLKGEYGLRQATLDNIEGGNVDGTHMVQSQGASEYMIDVARGETTVTDPATGAKTKAAHALSGTSKAQVNLKGAIAAARAGDSTKTVAAGQAYVDQFSRLP